MLPIDDPSVLDVSIRECGEQLVGVSGLIHTVDTRALGDGRATRVRTGVAERLVQAERLLPPGVHLLLVEGHRLPEVQAAVIHATEQATRIGHPEWGTREVSAAVTRYVAPMGSAGHVAGGAVDLTLCDDDGQALDLGSPEGVGEDESDGRCWTAAEVGPGARSLRDTLSAAMSSAGFVNYPSEWWHWSYGDRYWAALTGHDTAIYGPVGPAFDDAADAEALGVASRCDNRGRWGLDDELGTVNLVTPEVRVQAAAEVRTGVAVSLARAVDTEAGAINPRPAWHVMHLETERPYATADSVHLQVHGLATTHVDALGHMFLDGVGYNAVLQSDAVDMAGLRRLAVTALRDGVFTRGVLLDVASAAGVPWLEPGTFVDVDMLERAEVLAGSRVRSGDAVFVHTGLERRERAHGPEDPRVRAGLDLGAVEWLHERDVAVYSGDCIERFPERSGAVAMPLHQIGIARMGLLLLDCPSMTRLVETSAAVGRSTFLLSMAPLVVSGGTGSPVNPIATF